MNQQTFQENGPPCAIDKLSVGKTRKQQVLSTRNNPLISQIKGETKQNKVNTDVLAQVDGPICLTERNSCTNRRISTAPLSAACQHNTACNIQCHMTGYVFFCVLWALCFHHNSFFYIVLLFAFLMNWLEARLAGSMRERVCTPVIQGY